MRIVPAAIVISFLSIAFSLPCLQAQAEDRLASSLSTAFGQELKKPLYTGVVTGISVMDAVTGRTLFSRNADKPLITASVTKMIPAAACLEKFGPDRTFTTLVSADASPRDGILAGDIYLAGRGDPSLTLANLEQAAESLKAKGITHVEGGVVYDTSFLDEERSRYPGNARNLYAPSSALTVNYNWIDVIIKDGPPVSLELFPKTSYAKLSFKVEVSSSPTPGRPALSLKEYPWGDDFSINGTISAWDKKYHYVWLGVSRPGLFFATLFREACEKKGISFGSGCRPGKAAAGSAVLYELKGLKVGDMTAAMNRESNNVIAETLAKTLGAEFVSVPGTREKGIAAMKDFLVRDMAVPEGSFVLADASGLSAKNRFSAGLLTGLLSRIHKDPAIRQSFMASLAVQGRDPHAMNPAPPEGLDILVKTGTLSVQGVNTVAGYIIVKKTGVILAFAILTNREKPGAMTYSGTLSNPLLKALASAVRTWAGE